jgi:hypothetical protein
MSKSKKSLVVALIQKAIDLRNVSINHQKFSELLKEIRELTDNLLFLEGETKDLYLDQNKSKIITDLSEDSETTVIYPEILQDSLDELNVILDKANQNRALRLGNNTVPIQTSSGEVDRKDLIGKEFVNPDEDFLNDRAFTIEDVELLDDMLQKSSVLKSFLE